jgi:hypothetical protein
MMYSILGLMALSIISVLALPILLGVLIVGMAGMVAIFSSRPIEDRELKPVPALRPVSLKEQVQE